MFRHPFRSQRRWSWLESHPSDRSRRPAGRSHPPPPAWRSLQMCSGRHLLRCSRQQQTCIRSSSQPPERGQSGRETGFSVIELLIVVTVILILAAIAIPNYLRSRLMANEASAVQSVRAINTSEASYVSTYGIGYAPALANLWGPTPCTAIVATACFHAAPLKSPLSLA